MKIYRLQIYVAQLKSHTIINSYLFLFLLIISSFFFQLNAQAAAKGSNFPSINVFATFYGSTASSDASDPKWAGQHVDLGVTGAEQLNQSLSYVSWTDPGINTVYPGLYSGFDSLGQDFNDAFFHYSQDVNIPKNSSDPVTGLQRINPIEEDRFFSVLNFLGSPIWDSGADAKWGSSLFFNGGSNFVNLGTGINSQITRAVTFEAWIKPQVQASTSSAVDLIFGWHGNGFMNGLWIDTSGNLVGEININGARQQINKRYNFQGAYNVWYHVVAVGDANSGATYLYVNGALIGKVIYPSGGNITNILSFPLGIGNGFKGNIDDVRIYNRALTLAEVQARYTTNTYISSGLVGYWNLDEGQGITVNDSSGNNIQGYLLYPDITEAAYGDSTNDNAPSGITNNIAFSSDPNSALYIGNLWKFNEINFNLTQFASNGWSAVWEYWNGNAWTQLTVNDGTNNMVQGGRITFSPPVDWAKYTLYGKYSNHLFWVRLRNLTQGTGPIAQSKLISHSMYTWDGSSAIYGWQYPVTQINGADNYVVPGWDPANDRNGDGYVDNSEFANLVNPKATARLKFQSIAPSVYICKWRMATNVGNPTFQDYIGDQSLAENVTNGTDGVFVDNTSPIMLDYFLGKANYLEYPTGVPNSQYLQDAALALKAIKNKLGAGLVIPNTNDTPIQSPSLVGFVDGFFAEGMITFNSSFYDTPANLSLQASSIKAFNQANKMPIIQTYYDPVHLNNTYLKGLPFPGYLNRLGLYGLAKYYLIKSDNLNDKTYFSLENPSDYNNPQTYWIDAIKNNLGTPVGDYYILQTVTGDLNPPSGNLIYDPSFESENTILNSSSTNDWFCSKWKGAIESICNINTSVTQDGAHSLEIDGSPTSQIAGAQRVYQDLLPNTIYTVSGWIKTNGITGVANNYPAASIYITGLSGFSGNPKPSLYNGTQDWTFVSGVFTTGSTITGNEVISLVNYGTAGTAWFDNIKLQKGPVANIFARQYTKGMVILKPMATGTTVNSSVGDDTATSVDLGNTYQVLNTDGTLGPMTSSVSIDDFQGMILVNANNAANFSALNLNIVGSGAGSVNSSTAGISCTSSCSKAVNATSTVTLTASANSGSVFSGWSGACSGTGSCVVSMNAVKNVTAEFDVQYTLAVLTAGSGFGGVIGSGINCNVNTGVCSATLNSGTEVNLNAVPASGSVFSGWSGACTGMGNCSLTLGSNANITANFSPIYYTLTAATSDTNGTISPNNISIASGGNQVFTIVPALGYIPQLTVDGVTVPIIQNSYTLSNIKAGHTLIVSFIKIPLKSIGASTNRNLKRIP